MKQRGEKPTKPSLLERLFGGGQQKPEAGKAPRQKGAKAKGKASAPAAEKGATEKPVAAPAVPPAAAPRPVVRGLARSVAEIKQMTQIGTRDPERLAGILARLLAKERTEREGDKERFAQQVREIAARSGRPGAPGAAPPEGGPAPAAAPPSGRPRS